MKVISKSDSPESERIISKTRLYYIGRGILDNAIWIILVILILIFSLTVNGFFSYINFVNIIYHSVYIGLLVIAMSMCLICGQMDLSLESNAGLIAVLGAWLATSNKLPAGSGLGLSPLLVVPLLLIVGGMIGALNGIAVTKLKVNSFIVTLAGYVAYRGVAILITEGASVRGVSKAYRILDTVTFSSIPLVVFVVILLYIFFYLLLRKSKFGRYTYAIGDNVDAAKNFGVKTDAIIIKVFVIAGVLAALCGWFLSARLDGSTANTARGMIFDVFAAAVIGGISLKGGEGNLLNALGGVLLLGSISSALNIVAVPVFYIRIMRGGLIALAVIIDSLKTKYLQVK
jgi:ribose transport system permease protein